jgi:Ca2+-binding RTX toxin-like protein
LATNTISDLGGFGNGSPGSTGLGISEGLVVGTAPFWYEPGEYGEIVREALPDMAVLWVPAPRCTITGTSGNDLLVGTPGDDVICGMAGDDMLYGNGGDDALLGGIGVDTASYTTSRNAVTVDLWTYAANGQGFDTLQGIENVKGSASADSLGGDNLANTLVGNGGDDNVSGREGDDVLYGGSGYDSLVPWTGDDRVIGGDGTDTLTLGQQFTATGADGIRADLRAGTSVGQGSDRIRGVENLIGSAADDVLKGDRAPNHLDGGNYGSDELYGRGGDDVFRHGSVCDGGSGTDVVDYGCDVTWSIP